MYNTWLFTSLQTSIVTIVLTVLAGLGYIVFVGGWSSFNSETGYMNNQCTELHIIVKINENFVTENFVNWCQKVGVGIFTNKFSCLR